ncbi:unnamed protein product [Adineta ricciae]|uniref:Uncharacterized protein n=1 Tax=Adineta ricciae TaxID=249248 RepID=A0A815WNM1_ADIRI|nr:unnamed protein product [Adineta ricciae]
MDTSGWKGLTIVSTQVKFDINLAVPHIENGLKNAADSIAQGVTTGATQVGNGATSVGTGVTSLGDGARIIGYGLGIGLVVIGCGIGAGLLFRPAKEIHYLSEPSSNSNQPNHQF